MNKIVKIKEIKKPKKNKSKEKHEEIKELEEIIELKEISTEQNLDFVENHIQNPDILSSEFVALQSSDIQQQNLEQTMELEPAQDKPAQEEQQPFYEGIERLYDDVKREQEQQRIPVQNRIIPTMQEANFLSHEQRIRTETDFRKVGMIRNQEMGFHEPEHEIYEIGDINKRTNQLPFEDTDSEKIKKYRPIR